MDFKALPNYNYTYIATNDYEHARLYIAYSDAIAPYLKKFMILLKGIVANNRAELKKLYYDNDYYIDNNYFCAFTWDDIKSVFDNSKSEEEFEEYLDNFIDALCSVKLVKVVYGTVVATEWVQNMFLTKEYFCSCDNSEALFAVLVSEFVTNYLPFVFDAIEQFDIAPIEQLSDECTLSIDDVKRIAEKENKTLDEICLEFIDLYLCCKYLPMCIVPAFMEEIKDNCKEIVVPVFANNDSNPSNPFEDIVPVIDQIVFDYMDEVF
ncbi:MAG: hypothetical protein IJ341_02070 [Bacteroidales bacterium]|nr:hypothetical protein [Bacteroidales bacterium]